MGKRSKNKVSDYTLSTFAHVSFGFITWVQLLNKQYNFLSNGRKAMVSFKPGESDMNDKVALLEESKWKIRVLPVGIEHMSLTG